jgi:hypothetical protein
MEKTVLSLQILVLLLNNQMQRKELVKEFCLLGFFIYFSPY